MPYINNGYINLARLPAYSASKSTYKWKFMFNWRVLIWQSFAIQLR